MPWTEYFYILSNNPISYVENHEGNGVRVIRMLAKKEVVILPINDNIRIIVAQLTNNIAIPSYPKVIYLQK